MFCVLMKWNVGYCLLVPCLDYIHPYVYAKNRCPTNTYPIYEVKILEGVFV